jgi:lipoate-protein ligase A
MKNTIKFENWKPDVYRVPFEDYSRVTENAMLTGQYGIYVLDADTLYVHHGNHHLDYELCEELGIKVNELGYAGGNIIGSGEDLTIHIIAPESMGLTHKFIIQKITEIISKYVPNTTYVKNDILVNGDKVSGSAIRQICGSWVWMAQISFGEYSEYIEKICQKPAIKKPSYIDSSLLTRDELEKEILNWLRKVN